uniref:Uncharacterized protein n=1 Tax=Hemiselmis andersenii TaxID=464988 RepID=A0A6U4NHK1_HEMAN
MAAVVQRKQTLTQLVDTLNTLWGSDRVMRTGQFAAAFIASSPEVSAENRALAKAFGAVFSQTRYMCRAYGTIDGIDGVLNDAPKAATSSEVAAKTILYSVGGVGYHLLEHAAFIITIIRRCDEKTIPKVKEWLVRNGLWDKADDLDAYAQWCWFIDSIAGAYLGMRAYLRAEAALRAAEAAGDKDGARRAKYEMLNVCLDMTKTLCDIPLAAHYGAMTSGRGYRGLLKARFAALLGLVGSVAQFYSRFRKCA